MNAFVLTFCIAMFQGANEHEYRKGGYGDITWRLAPLDLVETL